MDVWKDKFIKPNKYSRPQEKLKEVRKIVIHWTANFGATANGHYNYFNTLNGRYASAHLFIDKQEALCIVPLDEITYHANDGTYRGIEELKPNANFLSIGIELCVEKDGSFHPDTIALAIQVATELCKRYKLDPIKDIVRHYDITHKNCPAPWIKNESLFLNFKSDVNKLVNPVIENPITPPVQPVGNIISHTVGAGETFYSISKKYGMEASKLESYNPRVKASNLQVGDIIHLIPVPTAIEKPVVEIKPIVKPKPIVEKTIGNVLIESTLNIRNDSNLGSTIVGKTFKGSKHSVYEFKNNMFRIGVGKWISSNEKYSRYTSNVPAYIGTIIVLADTLNVREKADFNSKIVKSIKKGQSYKVYKKINGMYHLGGNQYCSANEKYVTFKPNK